MLASCSGDSKRLTAELSQRSRHNHMNGLALAVYMCIYICPQPEAKLYTVSSEILLEMELV